MHKHYHKLFEKQVKMESRTLDYRHLGGSGALDYHPTPLIGEMATSTLLGDYHQHPHHLSNNHLYHRSIDTLRMLNERGQLLTAHQSQQSPSAPHHSLRGQHDKSTNNANADDISNQLIYQPHQQHNLSENLYNDQTSLQQQQVQHHIKAADDGLEVARFSPPTNSSEELDEKLVLDNSELEAIRRASSSSSPISRGGADSTTTTSCGSTALLDPDIFIKQEDESPVGGCKVFSEIHA